MSSAVIFYPDLEELPLGGGGAAIREVQQRNLLSLQCARVGSPLVEGGAHVKVQDDLEDLVEPAQTAQSYKYNHI